MSTTPPGLSALPPDMRAALVRLLSLHDALEKIESLAPRGVVDNPSLLQSAIGAALAPTAPGGSPAQIHAVAIAYGRTAEQYAQAFEDLQKVRMTRLPAAWKGVTAHAAAQQIQALQIQFENTVTAFGLVSQALLVWSDALVQAQHTDEQGRELLAKAGDIPVGPVAEGRALALGAGMSDEQALAAASDALTLAAEGCSERYTAALNLEETLSEDIIEALTQATTLARARHVVDASPQFAVLLGTALNPDGTPIVSFAAAAAGQQRFDALSAADQTAFEGLLASSVSPQQAAYVWKALAAGNSLTTVEGFDKAIRPHATNQQWLAEHLTPDLTGQAGQMLNQGNGYFATYKGQRDGNLDPKGWDIYDQGNIGDCAAASTVVAKATVDPVYMLGLTAGYGAPAGSSPAPGNDSPAAFHTRLQQAYTGAYRKDQENTDTLANQLLDPSSGLYFYQDLNSNAQRQAVLSEIEATAGSGQPVFIDVESPSGTPPKSVNAHQLVVVGYNQANNQLQIYSPWGFTQNVDAQQFVDGQLPVNYNGKPSGALPVAYGVEMPG
jgi:hypothetical protein